MTIYEQFNKIRLSLSVQLSPEDVEKMRVFIEGVEQQAYERGKKDGAEPYKAYALGEWLTIQDKLDQAKAEEREALRNKIKETYERHSKLYDEAFERKDWEESNDHALIIATLNNLLSHLETKEEQTV